MVKVKTITFIGLLFWGISSQSFAETSPYENMQICRYFTEVSTANYYLFNRHTPSGNISKKLLIFFEGRGKHSVLGKKGNREWENVSLGYMLNLHLLQGVDILIPEHIHLGAGEEYKTTANLCEDNFSNRVTTYTGILDEFLAFHPQYQEVYMMGFSEGGIILPKIYTQLETKGRITALILCASGGESFQKSLEIQRDSAITFQDKYRDSLNSLDKYVIEIKKDPFNKEKVYFGWPYIRWAYFLSYRPIDDLVSIPIPTLILHGEKDLNIPVESARAIVDAFQKQGKTNYLYREYLDSNHFFNGQFSRVIEDINVWLESCKSAYKPIKSML